jgi:2-hydroxymuconate-semialdehyde hydrolase
MDLVGFGRSASKPAPPYFDFDLWFRQSRWMIDRIGAEAIGVIGHSLSGALALKLAAHDPRVAAVLTTGTMGLPFAVNEGTIRTWTYPADRLALIAAAETLIHDRTRIDEAYLANRESVLRIEGYGAYFDSMFGGDKQHYVEASLLSDDEIAAIRCPVTLLHGRDDTAFPAAVSVAMAGRLPQADLHLIAHCSHSVAMEHPDKLLAAAVNLFPSMMTAGAPAHA